VGATYAQAGVNLARYNRAIARLVRRIRRTHGPEVLDLPQGFAGLYSLKKKKRLADPVLVSCSDGVGTKLRVATMTGKHDTVGIDLVAMSVNDLVVTGAEPLFFLDYVATGKLKASELVQIVSGIVEGCRQAGCALLGGETAEMPGMYAKGDYDLAGFAVGIVDRKNILDGSRVRPGDDVIGLPSSGIHSNGFSLVRKILFQDRRLSVKKRVRELGTTLGKALLTPTRIYVREIRSVAGRRGVRAMAHITGGGLVDNIPRVLPKGCAAEIREGTWPVPPIFPYLRRLGAVSRREMYRVFNMGIGMTLISSRRSTDAIVRALRRARGKPRVIGRIVKGPQEVRIVRTS
jgi:phosphoribosylformylglycinamidine cyclo-ligase